MLGMALPKICLATARIVEVLPVPGGPWNRRWGRRFSLASFLTAELADLKHDPQRITGREVIIHLGRLNGADGADRKSGASEKVVELKLNTAFSVSSRKGG
jgi:hypothetical protein